MKKKFLNRMNVALSTAVVTLLGLSGCENLQKYGCPEPELEVLYGPAQEEYVFEDYSVPETAEEVILDTQAIETNE